MADRETIIEMFPGSIILEGPEFDGGIVGYTEDGNIVYSYEKTAQSLAEAWRRDFESDDEAWDAAIDWLEVNTLRSIPYMDGGPKPIFIYEFPE